MKFKMQDKQNQLIERISDQHLVVGVDIAQQLHVARAVNFGALWSEILLLLKITKNGFTRLLEWIKELKD